MVREFVNKIVHSGPKVSKPSVNMDASVIFQNLLDHNAAKRVEILIVMKKLVKNSNGHLPFRNTTRDAVFEVLHHVLDDVRWEVRYQCLLLIGAIIPNANEDLDPCMHLVLPKVVSNLGHENMNIRRAALEVLHVYMKYTNNLQYFQKMFIQYGLESNDYVTRKGCITSIGILFTSDFANENLYSLVDCLSKHFVHGDASLFYPIFLAMQKLNELVGPVTFESYLRRIDEEAVNTYKRVLNKFYFSDSRSAHFSKRSVMSGNLTRSLGGLKSKIMKYDFGIFEPHIVEKIKNDDWKTRIEGIENMKIILKETPDLSEQLCDIEEFMIFLSKSLDDSNFKIIILILSLYDLLIDKFRKEMRHFLRTFVSSVLKRLGDSRIVVREHAIKVVHKLMHHVRPTEVLNNLLESKSHRNPRLREEIINRITAGVLTFPSYSFEFSVLCEAVAPLLVDTKRRVRLAALECFAVLAQAMGPTRMIPLVSAVDAVEINFDGEGLLSAVQARLARRILPRCTEDGAVTYAVTLPSSASYQNRCTSPCGADIDWIMAASGSSSSSTPPSRSKENPILTSSFLIRQSSSTSKRSAALFSKEYYKSEENLLAAEDISASIMHNNNNNNEVFENNDEVEVSIGLGYPVQSKTESAKVNNRNQRGSANLKNNLLPNRLKINQDAVKTRAAATNSRIPVLTANFTQRSGTIDDFQIFNKPMIARTLSAGRNQFLSKRNPGYSALSRKMSHNNVSEDVIRMEANFIGGSTVLRRVSPDDSPFGSKPILVRSPSLTQLPRAVTPVSYDSYVSQPEDMGNISSYFRPNGSEVIVTQPASLNIDDVNDINVIGIAVLDDTLKVPSSPSPQSWHSTELFKPGTGDSSLKESWHKPASSMPEVCGMHINSHFMSPASHGFTQEIVTTSPNNMDNSNISISKITREKMLKRQQEILKEAEERRIVRERSQQERKHLLERRLHDEKERQQRQQQQNDEDIISDSDELIGLIKPDVDGSSKSSTTDLNDINPTSSSKSNMPPSKATSLSNAPSEDSPSKREGTARSRDGSAKPLTRSSSLKTPSTVRKFAQTTQHSVKNLSGMSKHKFAASSLALFDDSQNNISPYPNPDEALKKALKALSTETWMGKIEGIQTISRLSHAHPNILLSHLHPVILALLTEVKNLRSSVSRAAILTIGDLFVSLKRNMEQDLELIISTLLSKSGETVGFIRDDIEKVMKHFIEAVTPNKAALAIISGGASHRNGAVRKTAAQSLLSVVEKMGATRILSTAKDVTERLLPTTAQFLMDGTPLTRYYGRRIFQLLMTHPSFEKLLVRFVQPSTLRNISNILDTVRKKGAGEKPKEGMSAKTQKAEVHRSGLLNRTM